MSGPKRTPGNWKYTQAAICENCGKNSGTLYSDNVAPPEFFCDTCEEERIKSYTEAAL